MLMYFKFGIVCICITLISGLYYQYHYKPIKILIRDKKEIASKLRKIYLKNSSLELELVTCLNDNHINNFEGEMKGAGDAIDEDNITINDKLIF